jgi:hypothetical protein
MASRTIHGTTPTVVMHLPFDVSTIVNLEIYFGQNGETLFTKGYNDCELSGNLLRVTLKQKDTLMLDEEEKLEVQARFRFEDDFVEATTKAKLKVGELLSSAVIGTERSPADDTEE